MKRIKCLIVACTLLVAVSVGKVKVVTSLSDLADFTKAIGGDRVQVDYLVRGSQNPHFIEIKPSYMMKLKSADLFITIGMGLELWAQQIIDGSRNPNLTVVDCSRAVNKLEVPTGSVDASQGDVHPFGNPHYWLDPENVKVVVKEIFDNLSRVSPDDREFFKKNMEDYLKRLEVKIAEWTALMKPFKGMKLVSYHTSFSYFASRFGISIVGYVEPKPGIPPTPSHSAELIVMIRKSGVKVIGLEQYYEENTSAQIAESTGAKLVRLSTSVGGIAGTDDYIKLMDYNVGAIVAAMKGS